VSTGAATPLFIQAIEHLSASGLPATFHLLCSVAGVKVMGCLWCVQNCLKFVSLD
jgi:hypothetical protein